MPKKFDDMVKAIKDSGKSEQDAYAIATAQWKKSHEGKAPQRESVVDEITRYLEEEGQPELFDADTMLNKRINVPGDLRKKIFDSGRVQADKITDFIFEKAREILRQEIEDMGYESSGSGPGQFYGDIDDEIEESNAFMMLTSDLCAIYIKGMEKAWPHLIMDESTSRSSTSLQENLGREVMIGLSPEEAEVLLTVLLDNLESYASNPVPEQAEFAQKVEAIYDRIEKASKH